jgi:hypothetical protein
MRYVIRGIPASLDAALRERARASGKSLNDAVIEALMVGTGLTSVPVKRRDLSDLVGTWQPDEEFDAVLAEHDQVDEDLWK